MKLPLDPFVLAELAESKQPPDPSMVSHFQDVPDFRREHGRHHLLTDILVIAVCATLADCDSYVEMAEYGTDNEVWLRTFLELPNGIPSHDTFRRIFRHLAPVPFQRACVSFGCAAADKLRRARQGSATVPDRLAAATTTPAGGQTADCAESNATAPPASSTAEAGTPSEPTANPPGHAAVTPTEATPATADRTEQPSGATAAQPATEGPRAQHPVLDPDRGVAAAPVEAVAAAAAGPLSAQALLTQAVAASMSVPQADADTQRRHLAVDGKTARGSYDKASGQAALHLVSVWASEERLTLGQVAVEAKSNEITAIPEALRLVDLKGAVVSIDAIGTQEAIVAQIRDGKGDYVLAVKENQPHLYDDVLASFERHFEQFDGKPYGNKLVVVSKGEHGRKEKRTYVVVEDVRGIRNPEKWRDVKRLIMVHRECEKSDATMEEDSRYFIGSAACGVEAYAKWVRDHWGIENRVHWVLDVVFHEDASRVRKDHATENLAMLRRLAIGLLGNDKTTKRSIKGKRKKAARNNEYLAGILLGWQDLDTPLETPKNAPPA